MGARSRLGWLAIATVGVGVVAYSCSQAAPNGATPTTTEVMASAPTVTRVADVEVVSNLLRQRQQVVDLAELAPGRSYDAGVLDLAATIRDRAGPELDSLQGLLWQWQADATGADHHAKAEAMPHACVIETDLLEALTASRGSVFDSAFLATLRRHELSSALAAKEADRSLLGPDSSAALARAEEDQAAVLTALASWPSIEGTEQPSS